MKKIFFTLSLAAGLALAIPALGQSAETGVVQYQAGMMQNYGQAGQQNAVFNDPCVWQAKDSAGLPAKGCRAFMFKAGMPFYGYGHMYVGFALMGVITVVLIWVLLLLCIWYLWDKVRHHNKH